MSLVNQFNSLQNSYLYKVSSFTNTGSIGAGTTLIDSFYGFDNDFFTRTSAVTLTCVKSGYYDISLSGFWTLSIISNSASGNNISTVGLFKNNTHIGGIQKIKNSTTSFLNISYRQTAFQLTGNFASYDSKLTPTETTTSFQDNIDFLMRSRIKFEIGDTLNFYFIRTSVGGSIESFALNNCGMDAQMVITKYA